MNEPEQPAFARLVMKVINSFQLMPAVTTRVVCLHSGQSLWDFSDVMANLLREAGAQVHLCSDLRDVEGAESAVREAIESNPALDRGAAYIGYFTTAYAKSNHTITAMKDAAEEAKSAGRLPERVVIIPIEEAHPDWKHLAMERTVELLQTLGDRDWQPGVPSIIVPITDANHAFAHSVRALPMARWHALFFGYDRALGERGEE